MTPVKLLLAIVFATVDARFANAMRGAGSTIGRQAGTRSFDRCATHARTKLKGLFCRELMFDLLCARRSQVPDDAAAL